MRHVRVKRLDGGVNARLRAKNPENLRQNTPKYTKFAMFEHFLVENGALVRLLVPGRRLPVDDYSSNVPKARICLLCSFVFFPFPLFSFFLKILSPVSVPSPGPLKRQTTGCQLSESPVLQVLCA